MHSNKYAYKYVHRPYPITIGCLRIFSVRMVSQSRVFFQHHLKHPLISTNKYFLLRKSNNQTMFAAKPYILGVVRMIIFIALLTITDAHAKGIS